MKNSYHFALALLAALLVVTTQLSIIPVSRSVDSLCAAALCRTGTTCRAVQGCAGPACPPQAACLPCVPRGVDDVCNRNRYLYAVLVGSPAGPSDFEERKCDPTQTNDEPNCPYGSVCVADGNGRGTCCFGKPDPAPEVGTVISNGDPVCDDPCGGCADGYICQKIDVVCIRHPCPPKYRCVLKERPGYCPIFPAYVPDWCPMNKKHQCLSDVECPLDKKCCGDQCGTRSCITPFPFK